MKVIAFIERCQRDVVEKILRHCRLWEGPLRTLATARAPPNTADSDRDASEPRELQLVLDPEVSLASISAVSNMPWLMSAKRAYRSGDGNSQISAKRDRSSSPSALLSCSMRSVGSQLPGSFQKPARSPHDPGRMDGKQVTILTRGGLLDRFSGWMGMGIGIAIIH